jgi:hypothetical protein
VADRFAVLTRTETDDSGTFGTLTTDNGFFCYTGELPWRENASGRSCIPAGVYRAVWATSPRHGECYHLQKVEGRTDIEIHSANWMGDEAKGLKCQLLGCIAPGRAIMDIVGQKGVSSSKEALAFLVADLEKEPFLLTINWKDGVRKDVPQENK